MIHILEKQSDDIVATLDENMRSADHKRNTQLEETFEFSCAVDDPKAEFIVGRNRVVIPDEDGKFREFIIDDIERDGGEVTAICTASYLDLRKQKPIEPKELTGQTVRTAGNFVLNGTEWEMGVTDNENIRKISFDFSDPYESIQLVATTFSRELDFRVEIDGNRIIRRVVDMLEQVGEFKGKEVEFGKDLLNLVRKEKTDEILTALLCLGPEKDDGSRLMVPVLDNDALRRWGRKGKHLWKIYEPESTDTEMTIERLTSLGKTELAKRINSLVEYEISQADLENVPGYQHEKVRFGDTLRIKDLHYIPPLYVEARVISVERSLVDKASKNYTLGEFIEYSQRDVLAEFDDFKKNLRVKILRQPTPPKGAFNVLWIDTSKPVEILYTWDGFEWKKATPTTASEIGAETPEGAQEKVDKIKNDIVYKVEVISSNGMAFKNGLIDTELTARVYRGKENITDTLPVEAFIWTKKDRAGNVDYVWTNAHKNVGSKISVSTSDVYQRATFYCDLDLPEEQKN
ncbi:phage tail spike protein [Priestia megaterium]|uniref:phage tail spike protein n=1 Tax=Priestia megaterium TaxID=1404 RepID=UPI002E1DB220|nr:phage tail spike protein [Priestia megaterium]MED4234399.1 phage tail spike protein [Priestia megaterium]